MRTRTGIRDVAGVARLACVALAVSMMFGGCSKQRAADVGAAASHTAAASAAVAPSSTGADCAATGAWAACSVLKRLDRSGLAPRRDSGVVHEDGLSVPGMLVRLGQAELEIFIYSDSSTRKSDESKLDHRKFITPEQEPSLAGERTLIPSANLLGILTSKDDHKRERVADAIMAGAPQP